VAVNPKVADFMATLPTATQEVAPLPAIGQEPAQPEKKDDGWLKEAAARSALDDLRQAHNNHPHVEKMIRTILAIVDARLAGESETAVFGRPDTCNVKTYHTKWKLDPAFADCLGALSTLAKEWQDSRYVRSLQLATERLQLAAPTAAGKLVALMANPDPNVQYRAATAILDRAGVETASKEGQLMNLILNNIDMTALTLVQIEALQNARSPQDVIEALLK
jgi:hypothetical protein